MLGRHQYLETRVNAKSLREYRGTVRLTVDPSKTGKHGAKASSDRKPGVKASIGKVIGVVHSSRRRSRLPVPSAFRIGRTTFL